MMDTYKRPNRAQPELGDAKLVLETPFQIFHYTVFMESNLAS